MTQPPQPGPWGAPQQQPPAWQPPSGPSGPPQGWPSQTPQPWPGQQPPHYGQPNPPAGFPAPPKRSGIKPWMWIVGVLVLLALISGVTNAVRKAGDRAAGAGGGDLRPGQCITNGDYAKFHFTATSCESSDAVYELAGESAMGICPDGKRVQDGPYFYVTRDQDDPKSESLCFALNLHQGDCYAMDLTEKSVTHIDCAQASTIANSHTGAFKVAKRADGSTDGTVCGTGEKPWVFTSPQRVYCLTKLVQ